VGKSAWGLALHEQSRLIAVSSNRREITIFALAIGPGTDDENISEDESISVMGVQDELPILSSPPSSAREYRQHGYRLLLDLGQLGNNIPSIYFSSNRDFEAESVFATDIRGNLVSNIFNTSLSCLARVSFLYLERAIITDVPTGTLSEVQLTLFSGRSTYGDLSIRRSRCRRRPVRFSIQECVLSVHMAIICRFWNLFCGKL